MIRKVLIANRGEIAIRIARTCRAMGISTAAVYSDADANAPHVRYTDDAIRIGPAASRESYLNIERIIEAAKRSGADAVHPGYGFLSENGSFAEACSAAGLRFIGPSAEAIRKMGHKGLARRIADTAGLPIVPGYDGDDQTPAYLKERVLAIGLPVMIKAAAGGGGKGMRVVRTVEQIDEALASAHREAEKAFADGTLLVEKLIDDARHIEVQILGDELGNIVHLFERDCSLQRRHQKVIEESPAPNVSEETRARMGQLAVALGRAISYTNAGTVEFLLAPKGEIFFIEANTRLQVEHPVTELITGLDIVRLQIEIAEGKPLPFTQGELSASGVAIEARLYAEDPTNEFLPATGTILDWRVAEGIDGLRVDTGIERGTEIGIHYDPLLAKVIVHGCSRDVALRKLTYALRSTSLLGIKTNRDLLIRILEHPEMRAGTAQTEFIDRRLEELAPRTDESTRALVGAVAAVLLARLWQAESDLFDKLPQVYRNNPYRPPSITLQIDDETDELSWQVTSDGCVTVFSGARQINARLLGFEGSDARVEIDDVQHTFRVVRQGDNLYLHATFGSWCVVRLPRFPVAAGTADLEMANAPMPGQVLKIIVETGQHVEVGDALLILEAMKMEQTIRAAIAGRVETILVKPSDLVSPGDLLVQIASAERQSE